MKAHDDRSIESGGTPGRVEKGSLPPRATGAVTGSSPGTGSVQAADGTTIEWSTAADGTITAVGAGGATMVVSNHGLARAAESAVAVGAGGAQIATAGSAATAGGASGGAKATQRGPSRAAGAAIGARSGQRTTVGSAPAAGAESGAEAPSTPAARAGRSRTEFSAAGHGTYLTIGTVIDESAQLVSFELVSGQETLELSVTVTGRTATASARLSGGSGSPPVSWSGAVELASVPFAIPGWPSDVFRAQMVAASYFAPACSMMALSVHSSAPRGTQPKGVALDVSDPLEKAIIWGLGAAAGAVATGLSGPVVLGLGLISAATSLADSEGLLNSVVPVIQQFEDEAQKQLEPAEPDIPDNPLDEGCFAAGTFVSLEDGKHRVIEEIAVGDLVASRDELSGQRGGARPVTRTWVHHDKQTIDLTLETGERIRTTSVHRIFTLERGLVTAGQLSVGDHVKTLAGIPQPIVAIAPGPDRVTVHNLTVDRSHTYFVGEAGVWVHNDKGEPAPDEPGPDAGPDEPAPDEPDKPGGPDGPDGGPSPEPA